MLSSASGSEKDKVERPKSQFWGVGISVSFCRILSLFVAAVCVQILEGSAERKEGCMRPGRKKGTGPCGSVP